MAFTDLISEGIFCGQERAAFVPILYEGYEPKSLLVTFW